jgi:hypothetical protein
MAKEELAMSIIKNAVAIARAIKIYLFNFLTQKMHL